MAGKKKPGKKPGGSRSSTPSDVSEATELAANYMQRKQFDNALRVLRDIDRRYPNNFLVLQMLAECAYDTNERELFLDICERLASLAPNDPDYQAQRAFAHAQMGYFFLAHRYFQQVFQRWPDHPKAATGRQSLDTIEQAIQHTTNEMQAEGYFLEVIPEIQVRHEQIQVYLTRSKYSEVRRVATQLLSRWPRFVAALNNLTEAWFHEGNLEQALESTRQAIAVDPNNVQAHANLVRLFLLSGKTDEARAAAEILKPMPPRWPEHRLKKAESLALLGDDAGVLTVWAEAEQEGFRLIDPYLALMHHRAAVAAWNLGDDRRARELWAKCFKADPYFQMAQQAIDDLDNPPGEQNGPASASLHTTIPRLLVNELVEQVTQSGAATNERKVRDEIRRFVNKYPPLPHAIGVIFARGDALSREIAVRLCGQAQTPELLCALREFALSQHGPDSLRIQAAFVLANAGELTGEVSLWIRGQWRPQHLMNWEITSEALPSSLSPRQKKELGRALEAMRAGDGSLAESILRPLAKEVPTDKSVAYNLANSLLMQGRHDEGMAIIRELCEKYPDYLFAQTHLARDLIHEGDIEQAQRLLDPFMQRTRLHVGEFNALAMANIELALAKKLPDAARTWIPLMTAVDPTNSQIKVLEELIENHR